MTVFLLVPQRKKKGAGGRSTGAPIRFVTEP
jgi:hypothetical protein